MTGTHSSVSGDVALDYPQVFQGRAQASTISGSIQMKGKDLRIVEKSRGFPKKVIGRKGPGNGSSVEVETMSGDVDVLIGDKP